MSTFYNNLAATAARLLRDKGQVVVLHRAAASPYDPATGTAAQGADTAVSVFGVVSGMPRDRLSGAQTVTGTSVESTDRMVLIDATGGDPKDFDTMDIGGERNAIVSTEATSPAGIPVAYKVHVRRGG